MKTELTLFIVICLGHWVSAQTNASLPAEIIEAYQALNLSTAIKPDSAISYFTKFQSKGFAEKNSKIKLSINMALAELYYRKAVYDLSLRHISVANNLFNNLSPGSTHYWITTHFGKGLFHRGNYLLAGQYFSDALSTPEVKANADLENEIRDYILKIYNILPSFSLSDDFFIQALSIKQKLGDRKGMKESAQKFSQMLYGQHRYAESLKYSKMSADLSDELSLNDEKLEARINMVNALMRLNKNNEAKNLLDQVQDEINPTDFHLRSRFETARGDYELTNGNETKAAGHYAAALPSRAGPTLSQYVYLHQSESYELIGNYKKALEFHKKYMIEINESYLSNIVPAVVQLEDRSARSKLIEEIKYLSIQNKLKDTLYHNQKLLAEALARTNDLQDSALIHQQSLSQAIRNEVILQKQKVQNERSQRLIFIGSSLVMFVMGSMLYGMYRNQKLKNNIIIKQSADNEILMKEIHHRVKNNLQIISSLLDMQAISIKEPLASEAIKESKNRVLSMALIHQNLYHDGHIRSIKVDDYIIHLSNSLFASYNVDNKKIKLTTSLDPINLDVDTVVPLGLIINEIMTNSLKYAFIDRVAGEIQIRLNKTNSDQLHFQIRDDGLGFPPGWDVNINYSFGYQLIKAFSKKLKAKLTVYNDHGAVVDILISKYKLALS